MVRTCSFGKRVAAVVAAAALAACSVVALSGCAGSDKPELSSCTLEAGTTITDGVLTVGVNANNDVYSSTNADGSITGLDIDIAAALADEFGCTLEVVDIGSKGGAAVLEGTVDIVMNGFYDPANTGIAYSSPYINDGVALFTLTENAKPIAELDWTGATVVTQTGTPAQTAMIAGVGVEGVTEIGTIQGAFDALESGQSKFLAANAVVGNYYAKDYDDISFVNYTSLADVSQKFIIVAEGKDSLLTSINDALSTISGNGIMKSIVVKWLGTQGTACMTTAVSDDPIPETFTANIAAAATDQTATTDQAAAATDQAAAATTDQAATTTDQAAAADQTAATDQAAATTTEGEQTQQ